MSAVVRFPRERVRGRVLAMECEVYDFARSADAVAVVKTNPLLFWPVMWFVLVGFFVHMMKP